jgi:general secretion pathway protein B
MSFILDALRKSEHERQRHTGPSIAELPVIRATSRYPLALVAIGALLAINLGVLLFWLLNSDGPEVLREPPVAAEPEPTPAPAPTKEIPRPAAVAAPGGAEAVRPQPVQQREVRPLTAEVEANPPPDSAPPPAPDPSLLPVVPAPTPGVSYAPRQLASDGNNVPRIDTLPPQATAGLPALNLDLHIYSTDPAERTAFINGTRYRAGDTMPEGVEVVAVTADGVVLRYRGQQFLLPRK